MIDLGDLAPYLAITAVLITASGFFSGSEVAMFSLRRVDREQLAQSTRRVDSLILRLLARPRRLIATLLIGNEAVNVSVSAVMASMAPLLYPGRSELELALLATFTALPILLLLGEITPKTIAIKTSVGWSRKVVRPLWFFSVVITPLRAVVILVANVILRPLGVTARSGMLQDLSEAEFKTLVDAGNAEGEVDAHERRLIHRVFEFGDKTVGQIMEPAASIFSLSSDMPTSRLIREVAGRGYSRVPIYRGSKDTIIGILHAKDLVAWEYDPSDRTHRLVRLLREPLFVPRTLRAERLFRMFKQRKIHLALVVDEYGRLSGLVTMEDLLEELFGEIHDEREQQKAAIGRRATRETQPRETEMVPPGTTSAGTASEPGGPR